MPDEKRIEATVKVMRMKTSELIDALDECKTSDAPCSTLIMAELSTRGVYKDINYKLRHIEEDIKDNTNDISDLETRAYALEHKGNNK